MRVLYCWVRLGPPTPLLPPLLHHLSWKLVNLLKKSSQIQGDQGFYTDSHALANMAHSALLTWCLASTSSLPAAPAQWSIVRACPRGLTTASCSLNNSSFISWLCPRGGCLLFIQPEQLVAQTRTCWHQDAAVSPASSCFGLQIELERFEWCCTHHY